MWKFFYPLSDVEEEEQEEYNAMDTSFMMEDEKRKFFYQMKKTKDEEKKKNDSVEMKNVSTAFSTLLNRLKDSLLKVVDNLDEDDPDTSRKVWELLKATFFKNAFLYASHQF